MKVMHNRHKIFFGVLTVFLFLVFAPHVKASADDDLRGWAWSERVGWISFNCSNLDTCPPGGINYGVDFSLTGAITGWAWSENVGWICFGGTCGGTAPSGSAASASINLANGQMRGWGRIVGLGSLGWISLSCEDLGTCGTADYRVTADLTDGTVSGWSWNGNLDGSGIGWMDWKFALVQVRETVCDNGLDDDNDGSADCLDADCDGMQGGLVGGAPVTCEYGNETDINCTDIFNNDADTYTDCADQTQCWHVAPYCPATETNCSDGLDNDADDGRGNWDNDVLSGRDCNDYDCAGNPACPSTEVSCVDGIDNDLDWLIDCVDPDCVGECTSTCSTNPARRCRTDADCAIPPPAGICVVQPWLQTKFRNLYSREGISSSNPPPSGAYNATYCLLAGSGVVSNFISDPLFGCGTPPPTEVYNFPNVANKYATTLGKIDVTGVLNGNYGRVIEKTGTELSGSTVLGGEILYWNGDMHVGSGGFEIRAGVGSQSGAGTIVVVGDLTIDGPITYRSESVSKVKNLASVGFLVLKRSDGSGGNVIINGSVQNVVGAFYVEGRFETGVSANPLTVKGLAVAREFRWGRTYADRTRGSEEVIYDGRAAINPPPGFSDVSKSLPVLRQGISE